MIRFDEVPIRRVFSINDERLTRIPDTEILEDAKFKWDKTLVMVNCIADDGQFGFIEDDLMVELVDVCKNCKHFYLLEDDDNTCRIHNKAIRTPRDEMDYYQQDIEQDPETFYCSEFEEKENE